MNLVGIGNLSTRARSTKRPLTRRRLLPGKLVRYAGFSVLALIGVFVGLVGLYAVAPPVSTLMIARLIEGRPYERAYARLDDVSHAAVAAVVASEDATFCQNGGVDWRALKGVMSRAGKRGPERGASTITMQTAKNLFLWPGRSVVRKGVEIGMSVVLGKVWSKRRTMEIYLNVAEWGDGIFGIEAASRRYFKKSARELDLREGTLLAASLPSPVRRNPAHPTAFQRRAAAAVAARVNHNPGITSCLKR